MKFLCIFVVSETLICTRFVIVVAFEILSRNDFVCFGITHRNFPMYREPDEEEEKYQRRWYLDYFAICWLFCMVVPGAYVGHEYVNPIVFNDYPIWKLFNSYLLYYGCFMLSINWFLIKFTNTTVPKSYKSPHCNLSLEICSQADYKYYCNYCNRYKPPRAHHCNLCKRCILKQDHHCFFVGTCIGNNNQRFFVSFTFWMGLGFLYCCLVAFWYVQSDQWRSLGWYDYVVLPLTVFRCLLGYLSVYELFCLFLFHSLGIATYASNFIFISQMYLIINGLTSFERKKRLKSPVEQYSVKTRLQMTFGPWWALNLFFPIGLFTKPLCEGCDWDMTSMTKSPEYID